MRASRSSASDMLFGSGAVPRRGRSGAGCSAGRLVLASRGEGSGGLLRNAGDVRKSSVFVAAPPFTSTDVVPRGEGEGGAADAGLA